MIALVHTHSQPRHIFEFLWTMSTFEWTIVAMNDLMFFQCAFGDEPFATFFTNERPIAGVYGTYVCFHVEHFAESFVAEFARMNESLIVGQVDDFVSLQFTGGEKFL